MDHPLVFLKLGGSLITDKDRPRTPCLEVIRQLAQEIAETRLEHPELRMLIGHGSGSFGHVPANVHQTRAGVKDPQGWLGFVEVWREARALNQIVLEVFSQAGLPVMAFPPSATMLARDGKARWFEIRPLIAALESGLIPLVQGDVVFDTLRGGTILSTEEVFAALAPALKPESILLAGIEPGVWADYPQCTRLVELITPSNLGVAGHALNGSASVDVTGGMREKVLLMLDIIQTQAGVTASIFSGSQPGNVSQALTGHPCGTMIRADR